MKQKLANFQLPANEPPWVTRRRRVPVSFAAAFLNLSEDSFKREHGDKIERISPNRVAVEFGKVLDIANGDSCEAA